VLIVGASQAPAPGRSQARYSGNHQGRKIMIRGLAFSAAAAFAASTLSALSAAPIAGADPGCESIRWGFLGSQTRQLCDGPIRPDGSWMRTRTFLVNAYQEYNEICTPSFTGSFSDSFPGGFSGGESCTRYPTRWVPERVKSEETYVVTPDTVLPDEPGHLG
jgi:hypothetical protein